MLLIRRVSRSGCCSSTGYDLEYSSKIKMSTVRREQNIDTVQNMRGVYAVPQCTDLECSRSIDFQRHKCITSELHRALRGSRRRSSWDGGKKGRIGSIVPPNKCGIRRAGVLRQQGSLLRVYSNAQATVRQKKRAEIADTKKRKSACFFDTVESSRRSALCAPSSFMHLNIA